MKEAMRQDDEDQNWNFEALMRMKKRGFKRVKIMEFVLFTTIVRNQKSDILDM